MEIFKSGKINNSQLHIFMNLPTSAFPSDSNRHIGIAHTRSISKAAKSPLDGDSIALKSA